MAMVARRRSASRPAWISAVATAALIVVAATLCLVAGQTTPSCDPTGIATNSVPFSLEGDTRSNSEVPDVYPFHQVMPFTLAERQWETGQWAYFTGTGGLVTVSTCDTASLWNSLLVVFAVCGDGTDCDLAIPVARADNECGLAAHGETTFCTEANTTYAVLVTGVAAGNPASGAYTLTVTAEAPAGPCFTATPCASATLDQVKEGELGHAPASDTCDGALGVATPVLPVGKTVVFDFLSNNATEGGLLPMDADVTNTWCADSGWRWLSGDTWNGLGIAPHVLEAYYDSKWYARGAWWRVTGTGEVMSVTLGRPGVEVKASHVSKTENGLFFHGSNYQPQRVTVLKVCADCDGLVCLADSEQQHFESGAQGTVSWCSEDGAEYVVLVQTLLRPLTLGPSVYMDFTYYVKEVDPSVNASVVKISTLSSGETCNWEVTCPVVEEAPMIAPLAASDETSACNNTRLAVNTVLANITIPNVVTDWADRFNDSTPPPPDYSCQESIAQGTSYELGYETIGYYPGVWYEVEGVGGLMHATTAAFNDASGATIDWDFDSVLSVYKACIGCGEEETEDGELGKCIASNDDGGVSSQAVVQWCSEPGVIYKIHLYGAPNVATKGDATASFAYTSSASLYVGGDGMTPCANFLNFEAEVEAEDYATDIVPCPPPSNDCPAAAKYINVSAPSSGFPAVVNGTTLGGMSDDDDWGFVCASGPLRLSHPSNIGPGVWYTVTGTGTRMTASTVNTADPNPLDTRLAVFLQCGEACPCSNCTAECDCTPTMECVSYNDNTEITVGDGGFSLIFQSAVSWCSVEGATYLVLVAGRNSEDDGEFLLEIDAGEVPCSMAPGLNPTCDDDSESNPPVTVPALPTSPNTPATATVIDFGGAASNATTWFSHGPMPLSAAAYEDSPCGPSPQTQWFELVGDGSTYTASTCGGSGFTGGDATYEGATERARLDTTLSVYHCCDDQCTPETTSCQAYSDDEDLYCSDLSVVTWCTEPGQTYKVAVSGPGAVTSDIFHYSLLVSRVADSAAACAGTDHASSCVGDPSAGFNGTYTDGDSICGSVPSVSDGVGGSADAVVLAEAGTTIGTSSDVVGENGSCGTANAGTGTWYTVTGRSGLTTFSTCGGDGGTAAAVNLAVFLDCAGSCPASNLGAGHLNATACGPACTDSLTCVSSVEAGSGCGSLNNPGASVSWCALADETYFVLVHAPAPGTDFDYALTSTGTSGANTVCPFAAACEPIADPSTGISPWAAVVANVPRAAPPAEDGTWAVCLPGGGANGGDRLLTGVFDGSDRNVAVDLIDLSTGIASPLPAAIDNSASTGGGGASFVFQCPGIDVIRDIGSAPGALVGDRVWMVGGRQPVITAFCLRYLDVSDLSGGAPLTWRASPLQYESVAEANAFTARAGHMTALDADAGLLYVFGGYRSSLSPRDDLWVIDLSASVPMARRLVTATAPPARSFGSLTHVASTGTLVLFGGESAGVRLGDLWAYSVANNTWTEIEPLAVDAQGALLSGPSARSRHAATGVGEVIFVTGGVADPTGQAVDETWQLVSGGGVYRWSPVRLQGLGRRSDFGLLACLGGDDDGDRRARRSLSASVSGANVLALGGGAAGTLNLPAFCPAGTYVDDASCSVCPPGFFSDAANAPSCTPCPVGEVQSQSGATQCNVCPGGSFANGTGLVACAPCQPGTAVAADGAGYCPPCDPGSYAGTPGAETCALCPAGRYQADGGASDCVSCGLAEYQGQEGRLSCDSCPTWSKAEVFGSTHVTNCSCVAGYYGRPGTSCTLCPKGGVCDDNTVVPGVAPGFFRNPSNETVFMPCFPSSICLGGEVNSTCAAGYQGLLCGTCVDTATTNETLVVGGAGFVGRYYRVFGACRECTSAGSSVYWTLLIALLAVVFVIVTVLPRTQTMSARTYRVLGVFLIALNFLQIQGTFGFTRVPWPSPLFSYFKSASATNFNLELTLLQCFGQLDYYVMWRLVMLLPVIFAALYLVIGLILTLVGVKSALARAVNGFLAFCSLMYMALVTKTFEAFDCRREDGLFVLDANPTIECYSSEYNSRILPYGLLGMAVYVVGIPAVFATILWTKRKTLDALATRQTYGYLFLRFENVFYWYELVVLGRSFILALAVQFFTIHTLFQTGLAVIGLFVALLLHTYTAPFFYTDHDRLEFVGIMVHIVLTILGVVFFSENHSWKSDNVAIVAYVVIAFFFAMVVVTAVRVFFVIDRKETETQRHERERLIDDLVDPLVHNAAHGWAAAATRQEQNRLVRAFKAVEELRYLDDEALLSKLIYTAEKYQQLAFGQSVYDPNMFRDIEVFFGL